MKNELKDWIAGFLFFLFATTCLYYTNKLIVPHNYFSWLEWFGIFMMCITLKTGIDTYEENDKI